MNRIKLIATASFGLEAVVKREVQALGYTEVAVEDGKVTFTADERAIASANLWLRSADRVLLEMGKFKATSFEQLFEETKALPWDEWLTEDAQFTVTGKSVKSKLFSVPDCQSIVKKAVVEKLKSKYHVAWFEETGPVYTIQVALLKDWATLTIDTSGAGLHKRGYRAAALEAPLKETLAAAMVQLSFWQPQRTFWDPLCGSGTIPIEAALIGMNIAPGLQRSFASEQWPRVSPSMWKDARRKALQAINHDQRLEIFATDIDPEAIALAKHNAFEAGVDTSIRFKVADVTENDYSGDFGIIVCNPPYGERVGEEKQIEALYGKMGDTFRRLDTWSIYILSGVERFEQLYGRRASRKRKLYNGRIKTNYFQYYGLRPDRNIGH